MREIKDSPYLGTHAFRQVDHDRFFGRAKEAAHIAGLWQANRLTVVSGPVASGKTSLLQAGVYPLMTGRGWDILPPGDLSYGATFPYAALPAYNAYTLGVLGSWVPEEVTTRLAGQTVSDFVRRRVRRHDGVVFAAIDQAEDLFLDSGSGLRTAWQRQFIGELAQAVREESHLHLLLLTRNEALDSLARNIGDGAGYSIAPLAREHAIEAVIGPVAGAGRSFADDAADKLIMELQSTRLAAVTGDGERYVTADLVEPSLLQVVCAELWKNLPPDVEVISARDVRAFGDVDTALASHWSHTIAAVATEHDLTAKRLREWILTSFVTQQGTRRPVDEGPLTTSGMPNAVARALVDRHLLISQMKSTQRWYELLSDRLIEPLRKAPDERPPAATPDRYLRAAERALTLGELDLAQQYAEQVLRASPSLGLCAEAHSLMGNLAFEREEPSEAEKNYQKAASLFEAVRDTRAAARQLAAVGRMLIAQGQVTDAVDELRAAVDRVPNDLAMQIELAVALWQMGRGRAAVAILTSVLGIDGGNPDALRIRGEILADLGNAHDAMLDLDRQPMRDRPSTLAAHGLALAELGDYLAANREIDDALRKAPRNGRVLLYAARASALAGDDFNSGKLARQAVDATDPPLSPQHRELALRLAGHAD